MVLNYDAFFFGQIGSTRPCHHPALPVRAYVKITTPVWVLFPLVSHAHSYLGSVIHRRWRPQIPGAEAAPVDHAQLEDYDGKASKSAT